MSDVWYYEEEGKSVGPVPFEQLKSELLKRADWRDQFVWRAGASDWIKAGDLPELATTPPPLPPRQTPPPPPSVANKLEPQKFLYKGPEVVITQTLAQFGNVTYPVNGIGSVRVDPPNRQNLLGGAFLLGLFGLMLIGGDLQAAVFMLFGAVICLIVAFQRPYRLMIRTASGDQQAFVSTKRQVLEEMKQAIEKAVVHRG
jgi:hypothetical protein